MRKDVKIIIGLGIFLILVGSLIFSFQSITVQNYNSSTTQQFEAPIKEKTPEGSVILLIDFGEGEIKRFDRKIEEGMTVFDLLKEETEKSGLFLKTKSYDVGTLIEAIGDKKNGQGGKYWLYYINGEMPQVSADKKEIKLGDKVEFKFEKSPF